MPSPLANSTPSPLLRSSQKRTTIKVNINTGIRSRAALSPNRPTRTASRLKVVTHDEYYTRDVPNLRMGSHYLPRGQPCALDERMEAGGAVYDCCVRGDVEGVRAWLDAKVLKVDEKNPRSGRALLHDAVCSGNVELVKLLLDVYGAEVNLTTTMGYETALHLAVKEGHRPVVFVLLTRGAAAGAVNKFGMSPLHYVDRKSIASLLLSHGASLLQRSKMGQLPLNYVREVHPFKEELMDYLRKQTRKEEQETFNKKLRNTRHAPPDKVRAALLAHIKDEKERRALSVIIRATRDYLQWRNGHNTKQGKRAGEG